jgi:conjugative transfer signal peptidase TraF
MALGALITCSTVPIAASVIWPPPLHLIWNASESAPVGLYRLRPGARLRRGDMVAAWTPEPVRALAARRHYLPANVPLVKRVAAAAGDRVCAHGGAISINGGPVALRQRSDPAGRQMPWWSGCRRLEPGQYFLLMESALSFDGRYFGPTPGRSLLGRAELLWAKPAKSSGDG